MKLTILGSGTNVLRKDRHESGYLIESKGKYYLFDSGAGTVYRLLDKNLTVFDINYIFYTHLHNDHINDLAAILWSNDYEPKPRDKKLFLYGPKGFKRYYTILKNEILRKKKGFRYKIGVLEITNKRIKINDLNIQTKELNHRENIAYRIENKGKVIVYSGDTAYCKEIEEIAKNADVLILECGVPSGKFEADHLSPKVCGKIAKKANVKKLILVHSYPVLLDNFDVIKECKKEYKGKVLIGKDLMEVKI